MNYLVIFLLILSVTGCVASSEKAVVYNDRGFAFYEKGQYDQAIADYDKAIEINPKLAMAYNNRGLVFDGTGQFDRAIADYNKAIEINPEFSIAYNNRGLE